MEATRRGARHLLSLSLPEQQEFLNSFDLVLCDCDGVVWKLMEPIPRTGEAINRLKKAGKLVKFVTNNAFTTEADYVEKFHKIDANNVQADDIVHPIKAIIKYLKQNKPGERVYSLASPEANQLMRDSGIELETLEITGTLGTTSVLPYLKLSPNVGAIVTDINFNLHYLQIVKAIEYLKQPQCQLLSGGIDAFIPLKQDLFLPGFADFLAYITRYSGKEAIIFGKPTIRLGEHLKTLLDIENAQRCLFIGDTLTQDVAFGKKCGFQTLFVLSGVATKAEMLSSPANMQPDFFAHSLADFLELYNNRHNGK